MLNPARGGATKGVWGRDPSAVLMNVESHEHHDSGLQKKSWAVSAAPLITGSIQKRPIGTVVLFYQGFCNIF